MIYKPLKANDSLTYFDNAWRRVIFAAIFKRPLKLRTGYLYHLISAVIFLAVAVWLLVSPNVLADIQPLYRKILVWVLIIWSAFRGWNSWMIYKRMKREAEA